MVPTSVDAAAVGSDAVNAAGVRWSALGSDARGWWTVAFAARVLNHVIRVCRQLPIGKNSILNPITSTAVADRAEEAEISWAVDLCERWWFRQTSSRERDSESEVEGFAEAAFSKHAPCSAAAAAGIAAWT